MFVNLGTRFLSLLSQRLGWNIVEKNDVVVLILLNRGSP
jgi:hypothetical protein